MTERIRRYSIDNPALGNLVKILCIAACVAMLLIAAVVYRADLVSLGIFALFIMFYVQFPGLFLIHLVGLRLTSISARLSTGFFSGWAFIILQYFLTELIGTNILLYVIGPIFSLIFMIQTVLSRRGDRGKGTSFSFRKLSPAFCIFVVFALFYAMAETQYQYLSPMIDEVIYMNPDKAFHIGLINSLSHGWPLESPWFSGTYYNYHVFTEMLYSIPVRLFGLTADTLLITCGPYMTVYAFSVSLYAFLREMIKNKDRAGLWCLVIMLSNIFIVRNITRSIALLFILKNENVAGYAVSCAFAFVIVMKYCYDAYIEERSSGAFGLFLLMTALLMLVTGIKGPFGLVLLAGIWGTFVLGLILRKCSFKLIMPLLIMSAAFLVIYVVILGSKGQSGVEESPFGLARIMGIWFLKNPLTIWMKGLGIPLAGRYLVLILVFTFFMLTTFFLPFVIGYVREFIYVITGRKDFYFPRIVIYACFLGGYIAMMILRFNGRSQIYFGFIALFFAVLIAIWFFEDIQNNRKIPARALRAFFALTLVFFSLTLFAQFRTLGETAIYNADPATENNVYVSITRDEYKAMRWIDENTPKDSLLATDRYYSVDPAGYSADNRWDNRFFLYADYSNRFCYLAGSGYTLPIANWKMREERIVNNDRLYDADDPGRDETARALGIDYVVVSKRFTDAGDLDDDCYDLCYSNDDVDVYEIK